MDVVSEVISLLFLKRCIFDKCEQNFCSKFKIDIFCHLYYFTIV